MANDEIKKQITINDIAKEAGVAIGTVSRAINNSGYVAKETKKRIMEIVEKTGFNPSAAARSLSTKSSPIIGIVVPEIDNPFLAKLVVVIEHILSREGFSILLCNSEYSLEKLAHFVTDLVQWNAKGLITISTDLVDKEITNIIQDRLNVVTIFSKSKDYDYIAITEWQGSFDLVEYLISLGHRKIAYVGYNKKLQTAMERMQGYKDALEKNAIAIREDYLIPYEDIAPGYIGTKTLLQLNDPPTAILLSNDYYAINSYSAVLESNKIVGKDISIVGFDDIPLSRLINPTLTTIKYDTKTMAELAAEIMIKRINNKIEDDKKGILLPTELVIRNSVIKIK